MRLVACWCQERAVSQHLDEGAAGVINCLGYTDGLSAAVEVKWFLLLKLETQ